VHLSQHLPFFIKQANSDGHHRSASKRSTGEQARAAAIQQQQQAPRLLHLATHAYFQPDMPEAERKADQPQRNKAQGPMALSGENSLLRSGIVFAGANQPDSDPADDGYLTALEVARLDWKGTELVMISACESGKGDIKAGEGVYGLKRAIAVAGARQPLESGRSGYCCLHGELLQQAQSWNR
jgi:CHAT domain-containing protein